MHNTENRKKAFLLIMTLLMIALAGCGFSEIGQRKAKEIAVQALEEKYGGEFKVVSIESKNAGSSAMKDPVYDMMVYSETIGDSFPVRIMRDGTGMSDDYEEYLYGPRIKEEVEAVPTNAEGWQLNDVFIYHNNLSEKPASADINEYKNDPEKLTVFIEAAITGNDVDTAAASLYEYVDLLQRYGYHISLDLSNADGSKRAGLGQDSSSITYDQVQESIKSLEGKK